MTESKGAWIDTKTGKVVTGKQPEEALQLVAPGVEMTSEEEAVIEAAKAAAEGDPETVTTKTAGKK